MACEDGASGEVGGQGLLCDSAWAAAPRTVQGRGEGRASSASPEGRRGEQPGDGGEGVAADGGDCEEMSRGEADEAGAPWGAWVYPVGAKELRWALRQRGAGQTHAGDISWWGAGAGRWGECQQGGAGSGTRGGLMGEGEEGSLLPVPP